MCQKAQQTAAALMSALEPTINSLFNYVGIENTPDAEAALNAYNAALTAVQNWQTGTAAQNVLQVIGDFQTIFNALPIPAEATALANIILAGIETVIGVISANSPAPAAPASSTASAEETQAVFAAGIAKSTETKVLTLVPGFRRSLFHSPANQYKSAWNKAVEAGHYPSSLKAA